MSIGGKLMLLGASALVVILVLCYGGPEVPTSGFMPPQEVATTKTTSQLPVASNRGSATPLATSETATRPEHRPQDQASAIQALRALAEQKMITMGASLDPGLSDLRAAATTMQVEETSANSTETVESMSQPSRVQIQKGDTLSAIAARTLGRSDRWPDFVAANPGIDPDRLIPGGTLRVPGMNIEAGSTGGSQRSHVVAAGETLSAIAKRHYGAAARWRDVFEANRASLSGNPDALRPGLVLVIP